MAKCASGKSGASCSAAFASSRWRTNRSGEGSYRNQYSLHELLGNLEVLRVRAGSTLVVVRLEIKQVRLGVGRRSRSQSLLLGALQRRTHGHRDLLRDVALDGERVIQGAVVPLGPEVGIAQRINQLHAHPQPSPANLHASLHDAPHAEVVRDLAEQRWNLG